MHKVNSRLGVIDLGTNTFHLLIVDKKHDGFSELYRLRKHVFLAQKSILFIAKESMNRAVDALVDFKEKLIEYEVQTVKIIGTAALRRAENAKDLIEKVKNKCGLDIEVISGQREANLIAQGTRLSMNGYDDNYLVMDIGGGSVEFILMNNHETFWDKSYPVGVAILKKSFHHSEPITAMEVSKLKTYLHNEFKVLKAQCKRYRPSLLVGASGSFEVLAQLSAKNDSSKLLHEISLKEFKKLFNIIVESDYVQRKAIPKLPASRIELIVVALVLIEEVLKLSQVDKIMVSPYALKEGVIAEMYNF